MKILHDILNVFFGNLENIKILLIFYVFNTKVEIDFSIIHAMGKHIDSWATNLCHVATVSLDGIQNI